MYSVTGMLGTDCEPVLLSGCHTEQTQTPAASPCCSSSLVSSRDFTRTRGHMLGESWSAVRDYFSLFTDLSEDSAAVSNWMSELRLYPCGLSVLWLYCVQVQPAFFCFWGREVQLSGYQTLAGGQPGPHRYCSVTRFCFQTLMERYSQWSCLL